VCRFLIARSKLFSSSNLARETEKIDLDYDKKNVERTSLITNASTHTSISTSDNFLVIFFVQMKNPAVHMFLSVRVLSEALDPICGHPHKKLSGKTIEIILLHACICRGEKVGRLVACRTADGR